MQNKSNYNKSLKFLARKLRTDSTRGEVILWNKLKGKQVLGVHFNRQFSVRVGRKDMILDFVCRKLKLVIEIDGYSHNYKYMEDRKRDKLLESNGYVVLRVLEKEVIRDIENVLKEIEIKIELILKNQST